MLLFCYFLLYGTTQPSTVGELILNTVKNELLLNTLPIMAHNLMANKSKMQRPIVYC